MNNFIYKFKEIKISDEEDETRLEIFSVSSKFEFI